MAKRRRPGSRGRDFSTTPNRYLPGAPRDFDDFMVADRLARQLVTPRPVDPYWAEQYLRQTERLHELLELADRRSYHPDPVRPAETFSGSPARLRSAPPPKTQQRPFQGPSRTFSPPPGIAFQDPRRVLICVRRNIRRGVLHALGVAGGSTARQKRRKRSAYTGVSCKE